MYPYRNFSDEEMAYDGRQRYNPGRSPVLASGSGMDEGYLAWKAAQEAQASMPSAGAAQVAGEAAGTAAGEAAGGAIASAAGAAIPPLGMAQLGLGALGTVANIYSAHQADKANRAAKREEKRRYERQLTRAERAEDTAARRNFQGEQQANADYQRGAIDWWANKYVRGS